MTTAVRERPMPFKAELVRAILSGQKTQTRRVMSPQPEPIPADVRPASGAKHWWSSREARSMVDVEGFLQGPDETVAGCFCPYGNVGDRLWVRTEWRVTYNESRNESWWSGPPGCGLSFVTHGKPGKPKRLGKQPSIHLPRWAAQELRLPELEITDVRVQRVHDISHEDALAEGVEAWAGDRELPLRKERLTVAQIAFSHLWDSVNKSHGWDANPFVWAISFRKVDEA